MKTKKLGAYILDHDEKSFIVSKGQLQEIEYSSGRAVVGGEEKSELLDRDYNNYIDFKLSFDELNFKNKEAAVEQLQELAKDISQIKISNSKIISWNKQFRISDEFDSLTATEKNKAIEKLVKDNYKNDKKGIPVIKSYKRTQDGWSKEIVQVKLERIYKRIINLENDLISIHTKSRDEMQQQENYKLKPYIYLVVKKNKDFGRKFIYLKQEISKVLKKHKLTSNHNVNIKRVKNNSVKIEPVTLYIIKELSKKARVKIIKKFVKYNFSGLLRVLIKKYLNNEIKITKFEFKNFIKNTDQSIKNKIRVNAYLISKDFNDFNDEVFNLLNKKNQINKMLNLLINKWIKNDVKISIEEFEENIGIKHK